MANVAHMFRYRFSEASEEQEIERQYFGKSSGGAAARNIYWQYRTVIFHYSNGTNKCCVEGCNATIEALTLEHEKFDGKELANSLGLKVNAGGAYLAIALMNAGFPDVNITVKCMYHNILNQHPEHSTRTSKGMSQNRDHINSEYSKICSKCRECKNQKYFSLQSSSVDKLQSHCKACFSMQNKARHIKLLEKAYNIFGYYGDITGMSFSHTNGDGHKHRKDIAARYNLKNYDITGSTFASYIIKDYEAGIPMWPGLIIEHINDATARDRINQLKKAGIIE